jgi:hypothetical protein
MDNRIGRAGDRRRKAAPMAPVPSANRRAGDGAVEWGKQVAEIAEIPVEVLALRTMCPYRRISHKRGPYLAHTLIAVASLA